MNEVNFYCLHCAFPMEAPKDLAGDVSECPRCLRFVPVPPETANQFSEWPQIYPADIIAIEIKFPCPQCSSKLEVDAREAGTTVYCPICTNEIKAPHLAFLIMPPLTASPPKKVGFARTSINLSPQEIEFLNNVKPDATPSRGKSLPNALKR